MSKIRPAMRDVILVLGMHRSGTSSVAGVLSKLGAALPAHLMGGTAANEFGYFESNALMGLNDELLRSAGSSWSDWRSFNPSWYKSPANRIFNEKAKEIFLDDFKENSFVVLKDPRICRFVPFWIDVINELPGQARAVIPFRFPLEVAMSLRERDRTSHSQALLLWLRHVLEAEANTRALPRSIFRWDDLLTNWQTTVKKISADIDINWPRFSDKSKKEIDSFLLKNLKHQNFNAENVVSHPEIHEWAMEAYHSLLGLSQNGPTQSAHLRLDQIRVEFNKACDLFGRAFVDYEDEAEQDRSSVKGLQAEKDWLQISIAALEEEKKAALKDGEARLASVSDRLQSEVDRRDQSIDELKAALTELEDEQKKWKARHDLVENDLKVIREDRERIRAEKDEALATATELAGAQALRIKELESEAEALRARATVLESETAKTIALRDARIEELGSEAEALRSRAAVLESETAKTIALRDERIEELRSETEALSSRAAVLESEMAKTIALRDERIEELGSEADALRNRAAVLESETAKTIALRDERIAELEREAKALRIEASTLGSETAHAIALRDARIDELEGEAKALRIQASTLGSETAKAIALRDARIEELEGEAKALRSRATTLESETAETIALRDARIEELQREANALCSQAAVLQSETAKTIAARDERIAELETETEALQRRAVILGSEMAKTIALRDQRIGELKDRVHELQLEENRWQQQYEQHRNRTEALQSEAEDRAAALEAKLSSLNSEMTKVTRFLFDAERERDDMHIRFEEQERKVVESADRIAALFRIGQAHQALIQQFAAVMTQALQQPLGGAEVMALAQRVHSVGIVDEAWYLQEYGDVAAAGMDPVLHYLSHGAAEGRSMSALEKHNFQAGD